MKAKLVEWLRRYLPLEVAGTACAMLGGIGASALGANGAIVAYCATWAENIGFYGCALVREVRSYLAGAPGVAGRTRGAVVASARRLILEFGPAELLDSFVLRPACMYALPKLTGHLALGLLLGKVLADIAFFGIAIIAYELGKTRRPAKRQADKP